MDCPICTHEMIKCQDYGINSGYVNWCAKCFNKRLGMANLAFNLTIELKQEIHIMPFMEWLESKKGNNEELETMEKI